VRRDLPNVLVETPPDPRRHAGDDRLVRHERPPANRELAELEEACEITPIVDAVGFDAAWIDVLLNSQGYAGLGRTRAGRPRRVIDAYSFRLGRALLDRQDAAPGHENGSAAARTAFARQREPSLASRRRVRTPPLRRPGAKGILVAYLSSLAARSGGPDTGA
jgi:hypothetical protein